MSSTGNFARRLSERWSSNFPRTALRPAGGEGNYAMQERGLEPIQVLFLLEELEALVERRRAVAKGGAGQAGEFVGEFALFEHPVLGMAIEAAPVGERDRDRARHPAMPSARLRHQLHAVA